LQARDVGDSVGTAKKFCQRYEHLAHRIIYS